MRQQSNTLKRKEQAKNSQEQLNEEETGNLPEKEFRVMIVTMISKILGEKWRQPEYTTKDQIAGEQKRKGIKRSTSSVQFSSAAQSCPTLRDPMNHSTPGLPVHHQLPEFTQTHIHRVSDAIQPSHPLSSPSPPVPNTSQHQSLFQ